MKHTLLSQPEIGRLLTAVQAILPLLHIGSNCTDSFFQEYSNDCHFLEFGRVGREFHDDTEPRTRIRFYPGQVGMFLGISDISVFTAREVWTVTDSIRCENAEIKHLIRAHPRCEHTWTIRKKTDRKARLSSLEIRGKEGGTASWTSSWSTFEDTEWWSHGTTSGYPWTERMPTSLKIGGDKRTHICAYPILWTVSIKRIVDMMLRFGQFDEFTNQLKKRVAEDARKAA